MISMLVVPYGWDVLHRRRRRHVTFHSLVFLSLLFCFVACACGGGGGGGEANFPARQFLRWEQYQKSTYGVRRDITLNSIQF